MTLVKVTSVTELFSAQVELLTVSVNDSGELGNIQITNSDGSLIIVGFVAGSTITLTRDALKVELDSNSAVAGLYSTANVSSDGVSLTQLQPTGPFTAIGISLGGTLAIDSSTTSAAGFSPPHYKLNLGSPVAGSTGEIYVSRNSVRGCVGEYTLVSNAVTSVTSPSITVEDTNNLLAPAAGPQIASEASGYMDDGFTTAKNGPAWVKNWTLIKEELEVAGSGASRVLDADYTVLSTDKTIYLTSTTSSGDHTITFATGTDGQRVTLMLEAISGTDEFIVAGVENIGAFPLLNVPGDSISVSYDSTADTWRRVSNVSVSENRTVAPNATDTILQTDKTVRCSTTTSAGDITMTFAAGVDGQEVFVVMTGQSGTDKYSLVGIEGGTLLMNGANDSVLVRYTLTGDTWYLVVSTITP